MSIILTCGHKVESYDCYWEATTKEWEITSEGWTRVLAHKALCESCYEDYKKNNALAETEAEEFDWLHGKEED